MLPRVRIMLRDGMTQDGFMWTRRIACPARKRIGWSRIFPFRLSMGKNGYLGNAFANCSKAFCNWRGLPLRGTSGSSPHGKLGGFYICLKNKSKSMRRRNGAESSFASKAKCLHFCKMLVGERSVRMVSHAAANFCETLPSEPVAPVRNALLLLGVGVQNPVCVFLHDQKKAHSSRSHL